ncbi:hypothetical protein K1T71_004235 [Dendrolimus kikuchii]|uniref:Uncharacterized protein n=1 Tax=Dendrolimus kikuchii TaxID=765133 RepID=A0ACC1D6Q8_9NEOP|nr:hypothetical protein K1T71_004235 [Dendrolimus kikuchii]
MSVSPLPTRPNFRPVKQHSSLENNYLFQAYKDQILPKKCIGRYCRLTSQFHNQDATSYEDPYIQHQYVSSNPNHHYKIPIQYLQNNESPTETTAIELTSDTTTISSPSSESTSTTASTSTTTGSTTTSINAGSVASTTSTMPPMAKNDPEDETLLPEIAKTCEGIAKCVKPKWQRRHIV